MKKQIKVWGDIIIEASDGDLIELIPFKADIETAILAGNTHAKIQMTGDYDIIRELEITALYIREETDSEYQLRIDKDIKAKKEWAESELERDRRTYERLKKRFES